MFSDILKLSEDYLYYIENYNDTIQNRMFKLAAATIEMGDPIHAGKGIAEIVKFLIKRIDPQNRPKALEKLKVKIWNLNEWQLSSKKMPASASLGQSISFVKNLLNGHNTKYIRDILREIVKNL